ncbi:hypothetical protein ACMFMG_006791 [Clarireedia jacksonii]
MPLLDLLKKKDKVAGHDVQSPRADPEDGPVFTFMRSDTHTQEVISPPTFSSSETDPPFAKRSSHDNRATRLFRGRSRSNSGESGVSGASGASSSPSRSSNVSGPKMPHGTRKISERLGLRKHEAASSHVPSDLPEITVEAAMEDKARAEVQWEKRATILAQQNERSISRPGSSYASSNNGTSGGARRGISPGRGNDGIVASRNTDEDLQEGIRLHESGQFEEATKIFARLADPNGDNHALSQILYGLALRHGWGCQANPAEAVTYLSAAASNAAAIEELVLRTGSMKGGPAKGELVIAIFELANCFRNGWGVEKDPVAAVKYYQTAAELGDTDSMNEVAWCFLHGFGKFAHIFPFFPVPKKLVIPRNCLILKAMLTTLTFAS